MPEVDGSSVMVSGSSLLALSSSSPPFPPAAHPLSDQMALLEVTLVDSEGRPDLMSVGERIPRLLSSSAATAAAVALLLLLLPLTTNVPSALETDWSPDLCPETKNEDRFHFCFGGGGNKIMCVKKNMEESLLLSFASVVKWKSQVIVARRRCVMYYYTNVQVTKVRYSGLTLHCTMYY